MKPPESSELKCWVLGSTWIQRYVNQDMPSKHQSKSRRKYFWVELLNAGSKDIFLTTDKAF